ncbi:armadillo-type protein [Morchella snyderi]|nr:armadillo-type protein [Morchella snyderi]
MTHSEEESTALALLSQLSNLSLSQPQSVVTALKRLKHELIGHDQKKELFVRLGIVPPLVKILEGGARTTDEAWGDARVEAGIAIGSLAYGGEAHISHLLLSQALAPLIASLNPSYNPPKLVHCSLRTLNTILDTASSSESPSYAIATALYTPEVLRNICKIISQTSPSSAVQQQICLAASLIANLSQEGTHEKLLVETGVLDALSARLGSFVVSCKATQKPSKGRGEPDMPLPAPQGAKLAPILDAISAIIKNSKLRSLEFLFSPTLTAIFPPSTLTSNAAEAKSSMSSKNSDSSPGSTSIKLPQQKPPSSSIIQPPQLLITPSAFPPLTPSSAHFPPLSAASQGSADYSSLHHYSTQHYHHHHPNHSIGSISGGSEADIEIEESPVILWLISQVRSGDSFTRLMATAVLTNLFKVSLISKKMTHILVLLVLPVLVRLLNEEDMLVKVGVGVGGVDAETRQKWVIQERAPAILSRLVMDSPEMQKAAVDALAIKKLALMLRKATESPSSSVNGVTNGDSIEFEEIEKHRRDRSEISHRMKVKEGAMRCLASLALFKDDYRKAIIEAGVIPMVVSSMKPLEPIPGAPASQENNTGEGNPHAVLIAACGVVQSLSRSVSILRTSLIDAGVAMPLFTLLRHEDIEVRVASTAAVCNLLLDFSPMRQPIVDAGVMDILCTHAKSDNASLRLNALWALKHLILDAESGVKRKCFEGLGIGWFIKVISTDDVGDQSVEDEDMAEVEESETDVGAMEDSIGDLRKLAHRRSDEEFYDAPEERVRSKARKLPPKAALVMAQLERREPEEITMRRKQSIAMQEQGLDFIRNFICNKGRTQMIDLLFQRMGENRLFGMLEDKLRPRNVKLRNGSGFTLALPPGEVVSSIVYILVHIAAGASSHRQILAERTELLKLLSSLWNHRLPNVRTGLAWIVINLTWVDKKDSPEEEEVRDRIQQLVRLGFDKSLEGMLKDSELDVRERVKTAMFQMGSGQVE